MSIYDMLDAVYNVTLIEFTDFEACRELGIQGHFAKCRACT